MVLLLILWYGLLVHIPTGVAWFMRFGPGLSCHGPLVFGMGVGSIFLHLLLAMMILLVGLIPGSFGFWVSFLGSLELVAFLMWNC